MSDLVEFKVRVPHRWLVAAPRQTIQRIERVLIGHDIRKLEMFMEDTVQFSGQAPRPQVMLLMAMAQGHDVEPILEAIESS